MTSPPPFRTADGRMADQIRLDKIAADGHHGVGEAERAEPQPFAADVVLHLDTRPAAAADDLSQTVDYSVVANQVHEILSGPSVRLVETLAERIAAVALAHERVLAVDVLVHKPRAPLAVPFDDVVVAIRRIAPPLRPPVVEPRGAADADAPHPEPASRSALDAAPVHMPDAALPDPLDAAPMLPVEAVLALGANQGRSRQTLREAVADLAATDGIVVKAVSPLAQTSPVGGPAGQDDYLNAVVVVETTLAPNSLLAAANRIEQAHGRVRPAKPNSPRPLDVDVITVAGVASDDPHLTLPHPRAAHRAFVLVPWAQIQPDAALPGTSGSIADLAESAPDRPGIRWLEGNWLGDNWLDGNSSDDSRLAPERPCPNPNNSATNKCLSKGD